VIWDDIFTEEGACKTNFYPLHLAIVKVLPFLFLFSSAFAGILVNRETGRVIVEFREGKIQFNDLFLEEEMKENGIYIPTSYRSDFEDKEIVYLDDPLFQNAFIDIYYEYSIANSLYEWKN
jgi:hypothetical protein